MSTPFDTEYFGLQIIPSWYRKPNFPKQACGNCFGTGQVYEQKDVMSWFEELVWCPRCGGSGKVNKDIKPPEFPQGMDEYMRKAWQDFIKLVENEREAFKGSGI